MDLLGSIMGSMDKAKPAPPSEKEKIMKKKKKVRTILLMLIINQFCRSLKQS